MKQILLVIIISINSIMLSAKTSMDIRGVVYDMGLRYGEGVYSVDTYDEEAVKYDLNVISNILRCNTVRIEGEDIDRLVKATRLANAEGLKVFFNPWLMGAGVDETVAYMAKGAKAAEMLRKEGIDVVFVAGCEYSLFSKGVFPGEEMNDRLAWLGSLATNGGFEELVSRNKELNKVLGKICKAVRKEFKGKVTYASGTWEYVDWDMFDIVGVDYYRRGETDEEYLAGLDRYRVGKPIVVMEMGCCAYKGAAKRGGEAFAILQGVDENGNGIYEGGVTPVRSEKEQADYVETQLRLLDQGGADGAFVFVFKFPVMPYSEEGVDRDMTSYSLVKSYPAGDSHNEKIPAWTPKEVFYTVGEEYLKLENRK